VVGRVYRAVAQRFRQTGAHKRGKENVVDEGRRERSPASPICFTEKSGRWRNLRIRSYSHASTAAACNGSTDGGLCGTPPTCGGAGQAASAAKKSASVATTRGRPNRESRPSPVDTTRHLRTSRAPSARKARDPPDGWGPGVSDSRRTSSAGTLVGRWATGIPSWAE
jgi:hypothetical protein